MNGHDGRRYLYVEDDPLSREVMATLMRDVIGITDLTIFSDSFDFLEKLRALSGVPDIVFLDIHVHPQNGFELLQILRTEPGYQHTRVFALTASVLASAAADLREAGFDGALAKPIDMLTFPGLVRRLEAGESIWQIE